MSALSSGGQKTISAFATGDYHISLYADDVTGTPLAQTATPVTLVNGSMQTSGDVTVVGTSIGTATKFKVTSVTDRDVYVAGDMPENISVTIGSKTVFYNFNLYFSPHEVLENNPRVLLEASSAFTESATRVAIPSSISFFDAEPSSESQPLMPLVRVPLDSAGWSMDPATNKYVFDLVTYPLDINIPAGKTVSWMAFNATVADTTGSEGAVSTDAKYIYEKLPNPIPFHDAGKLNLSEVSLSWEPYVFGGI